MSPLFVITAVTRLTNYASVPHWLYALYTENAVYGKDTIGHWCRAAGNHPPPLSCQIGEQPQDMAANCALSGHSLSDE